MIICEEKHLIDKSELQKMSHESVQFIRTRLLNQFKKKHKVPFGMDCVLEQYETFDNRFFVRVSCRQECTHK